MNFLMIMKFQIIIIFDEILRLIGKIFFLQDNHYLTLSLYVFFTINDNFIQSSKQLF